MKPSFQTQSRLLEQNQYSDFFTNLVIHPNKRDLAVLREEDSLKRALKNLIMTSPGERPFSSYGCNLKRHLYEQIDEITLDNIKKEITSTIENHEKRVKLVDVLISFEEQLNSVYITVYFTKINTSEPIRLDIKVERTR